ncbi:MAG: HEPN domain-containing protein [Muribaculaceae bacterium]|nr:HEPN domain-containing protein [Muribaculaceae bacterium]
MTDKLDTQARADLIAYKLDKANKTVKEADLLADAGFFNACVNRLYYAAYYAASALMISQQLETATHKGIKTMLGMRFIQPGLLDPECGRIYQQLFDSRQAADYDDFVYNDQSTYDELRPKTLKFISAVTRLLN